MSGVLIAHRGAVRVEKKALYEIATPEPTSSWKPIPHGVLVDTLGNILHAKGLVVRKEEYAIQRHGNILFGILDLLWGETAEFYATIGLRTSNDKSMALQLAIGMRVVVCDNMMFSGELIALRRKHTGNLDLMTELSNGIERYMVGYQTFTQQAEILKSTVMSPEEARHRIYRAFATRIVPVRLFPDVAVPYLDTIECPTLWDILQSFTSAAKKLKPSAQFETTVRLGKFFTHVPVVLAPQHEPLAAL